MSRVLIDRNDWKNDNILHVARIHADAGTRENIAQFGLTPAQACLAWWGMRLLRDAIRDSVRWCDSTGDFADDLRCHADASEWATGFMAKLAEHAHAHDLEVTRCG